MNVLFVSKAMTVSAYRDRLRELAALVRLRAVAPSHWDRPADPPGPDEPWLSLEPAAFTGRNHFHVYRNAARIISGGPRPDIVHIDEEPYSAVTAQIARQCVRRRLPFLFFAWQNIAKRIPPPFDRIRSRVFRHAAGGIAGTEAAGAVLRTWGFNGPLAIVPQMGVDPERFRPDPAARATARARIGADDDDFVIGFAGRLVEAKGIHDLLTAAFAGGPDDHARLVFLGDGRERLRLERTAVERGVAARVRIEGGVPSRDVADWLPGFDAVVLPSLTTRSWKEQFGRILVEAMACAVPVIGSSSGEIPNVIGAAGMVVPEGDVPALARAIATLARSKALRVTLGRMGRERVLARWTNRQIAAATTAFYERILEPARAPAQAP